MAESKSKSGFWSSLFGGGQTVSRAAEPVKWPARARMLRTQMKKSE